MFGGADVAVVCELRAGNRDGRSAARLEAGDGAVREGRVLDRDGAAHDLDHAVAVRNASAAAIAGIDEGERSRASGGEAKDAPLAGRRVGGRREGDVRPGRSRGRERPIDGEDAPLRVSLHGDAGLDRERHARVDGHVRGHDVGTVGRRPGRVRGDRPAHVRRRRGLNRPEREESECEDERREPALAHPARKREMACGSTKHGPSSSVASKSLPGARPQGRPEITSPLWRGDLQPSTSVVNSQGTTATALP